VKIISAFSFKPLLISLTVVPLMAAMALGVVSSFEAYQTYEEMSDAVALERLARAGGNLLLVLPVEGAAAPSERVAKRANTDAAYKEVVDAYEGAVASGYDDSVLRQLKTQLTERYARIGEFRSAVDADRVDPIMPLKYLQPISAMGMEITGRTANLADDRTLSQRIQGYYALLQLNDSYLIMNRIGQVYTKAGTLDAEQTSRFHSGYAQVRIYMNSLREFLPKTLFEQYESFWQLDDARAVQKKIEAMAAGQSYTPAPGDLDAWNATMAKRRDFVASLANAASEEIGALAEGKLDDAHHSFLLIVTVLGGLIAVTIVFSMTVLHALSGAIHRISQRMQLLAEGDKAESIPFLGRKDEIGHIAKSVEVFRQAALRNDELEIAAQEGRRRAETERVELQARAEAEANERLNKATGSLAGGLKRLASGDMLCEIHEQFAPQFEALRQDFNLSVAQLRQALLAVEGSASAVRGGSNEISSATDNLSRRTEQQAASLEETAAALEEITSNVKATSQRSQEARDLVRGARGKAEYSSNVVSSAVLAMGRIEQASKQINQIIGVIDEIAFQTNLLALNAGVEAARAGEAGKGFAVVAQEVRELAQRSANAAKEIKSLISNSTVAVSEGVKLVDDTGNGLKEIADLVQAINGHMEAIASAAQEQSVGLAEVNTAVNHMDQATQQNAAMVEEMNASSVGLAQEAEKLSDLLGQFRTHQDGHSAYNEPAGNARQAGYGQYRRAG
jgi:methyl-accepting chemotaxis protein